MRDSSGKLIALLWGVIVVILLGSGAAVYVLVHRANQLTMANSNLRGDNASLHRQVVQLREKLVTPSTPTPPPLRRRGEDLPDARKGR